MKYAIVNGERREAVRGLAGACPICEVPVRPRCGRIRVPHWYHPPGIFDHHWEPETEWHRRWKDFFPKECQEVCHRAENGERHLADVKTAHGMVLEFQNSQISEEERSSRETIYRPMMCWVVNGLARKNDRQKFFAALRLGQIVQGNPMSIAVPTANCVLLRKWENSGTLVLFDFGENEEEGDPVRFNAPVLLAMRPGSPKGHAILTPVLRARFVDAMLKNEPLPGINFGANVPPAAARQHLVVQLPPTPWMRPRRSRRF